MTKKYIEASSLAKKHKVSMSTIRRRISEGKLFPNAIKRQMGFGEIWLIPRSEANAASLKDISPKLYRERHSDETNLITKKADPLAGESLEKRVARLEQLFVKLAASDLSRGQR